MVQVGITYKAFVDKEKLFTTCFFCKFRFSHKTFYLNDGCIFFHRDKSLIVIVSENMDNTLFQRLSWQMVDLISVTM
ncbi:hypothetical protein D3C72_1557100 [compost metagenome]